MSSHTPEPWRAWTDKHGQSFVFDADSKQVCHPYKRDDAERVASCVNACAGVKDPVMFIENAKRLMASFGTQSNAIGLMRAALGGGSC